MPAIATAFNQTASRQDAVVFDYTHEVQQVWRDYPQIKNSIFFWDLCTRDIVYPGDQKRVAQIRQQMAGNFIPKLVDRIAPEKMNSYLPLAACGNKFGCLFIWTGEEDDAFLEDDVQDKMLTLDHELGHALVPEASDNVSINMQECLADAYGVIRHFQRYGAQSVGIEDILARRAVDLIFSSEDRGGHFTSPVIEKILAQRHDIDWQKLSPHQTIELAEQFARRYAMSQQRLTALYDAFKKARQSMTLEDAAAIVLSTKSPDVFKYGAFFLRECFAGKLKKIVANVFDAKEKYWEGFLPKLAEKEKEFVVQKTFPPSSCPIIYIYV